MEELQWGLPIATPQSLNKPLSINGKKKWWWIETRASEAKGPFPGGKRVGSWGKEKKKEKERERKRRGANTSGFTSAAQ